MRQAIVIIHGIGEQRPMTTLRGFVKSILAVEKEVLNLPPRDTGHWVMPDGISENYELRKITAKKNKNRPTTDFYEYYWANNMRDTTLGHVLPWLKTLLQEKPSNVPSRLLPVWLMTWVMLLAGIGFSLLGGLQLLQSMESTWPFIFSAASFFISFFAQLILVRYIGDAARYLTADPENIGERQNIRKNGIDLIRKIHESDRDYQRIVIVGHSLGTVIGYDIITYLWEAYRKELSLPPDTQTEPGEMIQPRLYQVQKIDPEKDPEGFRRAQVEALKEQQAFRNKWLISDFITLGSPLAHAQMLMANSKADLASRIEDREYSTCPPVRDEEGLFTYQNYFNKEHPKLWYLHHAAPFACTRWTNLYFQGDIIGGPLAPVFGSGIRDTPLRFSRKNWLSKLPTSHTRYWLDHPGSSGLGTKKESIAIQEIYKALDLGLLNEEKE